MDTLPDLRCLHGIDGNHDYLKANWLLPTLIIIIGRIRETAKRSDAASMKKRGFKCHIYVVWIEVMITCLEQDRGGFPCKVKEMLSIYVLFIDSCEDWYVRLTISQLANRPSRCVTIVIIITVLNRRKKRAWRMINFVKILYNFHVTWCFWFACRINDRNSRGRWDVRCFLECIYFLWKVSFWSEYKELNEWMNECLWN